MNVSYAARVEQAVDYLVILLKLRAPKKTGNLATNAIRKAWDGKSIYPIIVIGGEPAPYAIYTNEPWIADRWHGAVNPNMYWVQSAVEEARPILVSILSGEISEEDYSKMMETQQAALQGQLDLIAEGVTE